MDNEMIEPLRIHWDAVVRGETVNHDSIDSTLAGVIDQLHALDRAPSEPSPDPVFAERLEGQLMTRARGAATSNVRTSMSLNGHVPAPLRTAAIGKWDVERLRTPVSVFSTLVLFGLILGIAALVWITRDSADPDQPMNSHAAGRPAGAGSPVADVLAACTAPPRDRSALAALTGTPKSSLPDPALPGTADLNARPANERTAAQLREFVSAWIACGVALYEMQTPDPTAVDRFYGFYSDDYFRRNASNAQAAINDLSAIVTSARSGAPVIWMESILWDGRAGFFVTPYTHLGSGLFVVLARSESSWLVDEIRLIEDAGPFPTLTPTTPPTPFVDLSSINYNPGEIVQVATATIMRVGPSLYSEQITPIRIGTELQILDSTIVDEMFLKVGIPGTEITGWVPVSDVTSIQDLAPSTPVIIEAGPFGPIETPSPAVLKPGAQVTTVTAISIWTEPSFDMDKLELIEPGTLLIVLDDPIDAIGVSWVKVRSHATGVEGWIMKDYLRLLCADCTLSVTTPDK